MSTVRARDGVPIVARWSSGLRLRPLTPATAVRIRYGSPKRKKYGKHRIPNRVGVDSEEGPPVPIPNTVVKLFRAENTWRAAAREDKATPTSLNSRFVTAVLLSRILSADGVCFFKNIFKSYCIFTKPVIQ